MRELPRGLTEKKGFIAALKRYPTKNQNFWQDRKSTRLNSSHQIISYAVFCLKKKKTTHMSRPEIRADSSAIAKFKTTGPQCPRDVGVSRACSRPPSPPRPCKSVDMSGTTRFW